MIAVQVDRLLNPSNFKPATIFKWEALVVGWQRVKIKAYGQFNDIRNKRTK